MNSSKTKLWYLQNFNLFEGMDKSMMQQVDTMASMSQARRKEKIYFPDQPSNAIYFLKEGKIKIYRLSEDGRSTSLQLLGPGEIFGESALIGQRQHEDVAEVIEDATICALSKTDFQDLMNKNPGLNRQVNKFIGFRLRQIQTHVEDLVFKTARERVLAFLRRYTEKFGKQMVDGWIVRPFLNHQEIADLTANSRQTVNTILNELEDRGKIRYTRRMLQLNGNLDILDN